jgi:3-phosphoshikimate 1-carboxyvinyltransferase
VAATDLTLFPASRFGGRLAVPGDKSISHRYVLLGSLAEGTTLVSGLAPGADVASSVACMQALGAAITRTGPDALQIKGRGRVRLAPADGDLNCNNSGTTMRLLAGVVASHPFRSRLIGDASLSRRPMRRVIEPLAAMGAEISARDGRAPLEIIGGNLQGIDWTPQVASAQIKSAILLAGLAASGTTTVREPMPTRDHTERAFDLFGIKHQSRPGVSSLQGGQLPVAPAIPLRVPGDPSSAAVWAAIAASHPGWAIEIEGVCLNPLRLGFVHALSKMGAEVRITETARVGGEAVGLLRVAYGSPKAVVIDPPSVPSLIDELPVLAAAAALGAGLRVSGASELRVKESDRIAALADGFRRLGIQVTEKPDGFDVDGGQRATGGVVDAHLDHRLVLAFTVLALSATGPTTITGANAVSVSYPGFHADLMRLAQ